MQKILILGDAVAPTGFSRVLFEIMKPMTAEFEIHQLGVNYQGGPHHWPWKIYPAKESENGFGFKRLARLLDEIRPEIIFMLSDDLIIAEWMKVIRNWEGRKNARVLIYCPVDTHPVLPEVAAEFVYADRLITYTEFGKNCFLDVLNQNPKLNLPAIETMPHGINTDYFFPVDNDIDFHLGEAGRLKAKRRLARGENTFDNSFIVLNANRNQERKRLDITIKGFAEFAKGKPDTVMLYLHCGVKDLGWNLIDFAKREGIYDRLIMTSVQGTKPAVSNEELNMIYNACDVGINTSSAEGWGLVSFEHAAAGAAQIVPDHTGCSELWKNHAEMLNPALSITDMEMQREYYLISPKTVAESLERFYSDRKYLRQMSLAAFENTKRAEYNWKIISSKWRNIFLEEAGKIISNADRTEKSNLNPAFH